MVNKQEKIRFKSEKWKLDSTEPLKHLLHRKQMYIFQKILDENSRPEVA